MARPAMNPRGTEWFASRMLPTRIHLAGRGSVANPIDARSARQKEANLTGARCRGFPSTMIGVREKEVEEEGVSFENRWASR
jgi:hypothetical protein